MSYDIDLVDPITKEVITIDEPHQLRGGTYAIGGTTKLSFNITYNYSMYFYEYIDKEKGIRWLYGKKASDTFDKLKKAIEILGIDISDNYWDATRGNAGKALQDLLTMGLMKPEGIWNGD